MNTMKAIHRMDGPGSRGREWPGTPVSRRDFVGASGALLAGALAGGVGGVRSLAAAASDAGGPARKARIAITLDLEMARNFPRWEDTRWDYEKGNLNAEAKRYAVEAARRVKAKGGVIHFFAVGQVFEQENVDWLKELHAAGHPIGNHTYDHVYVLAKRADDVQFKFKRAPWLIGGRTPAQVIRDNVRLCTEAMQARLGVAPAGFRTPGGFTDGLHGRPDVQEMLVESGFKWVSCKYPAHPYGTPGQPATHALAFTTTPHVETQREITKTGEQARGFNDDVGVLAATETLQHDDRRSASGITGDFRIGVMQHAGEGQSGGRELQRDRKSTRLNSSHT